MTNILMIGYQAFITKYTFDIHLYTSKPLKLNIMRGFELNYYNMVTGQRICPVKVKL